MTAVIVGSFAAAAGTPEHLSLSGAVAWAGPVEAYARVQHHHAYVSLAGSLGNVSITSAYGAHRSQFVVIQLY